MPKLSIFKAPKTYSSYLFWRTWHQEKALIVMAAAAVYALGRWVL